MDRTPPTGIPALSDCRYLTIRGIVCAILQNENEDAAPHWWNGSAWQRNRNACARTLIALHGRLAAGS